MLYFLIRLGLSLAVSFTLLVLFLRSVRLYRKERCEKAYQVYLPSLLALLLLSELIFFTSPKVLDLVAILRQNLPFVQISVSDRQSLPGQLKSSDGEIYTYSPFAERPEAGQVYHLSYTPYSKFIIRMDKANP